MANHLANRPGCCMTFAVDDVVPAPDRLPCIPAKAAIDELLGEPIIACSDYTRRYVAGVRIHPVAATIDLAHAQHRPLILTPDAIWLTIIQGIAHHVALDPRRWRDALVEHSGRRTINVLRSEDFLPDSPEADWTGVIADFRAALEQSAPAAPRMLARFSTTGAVEWTAQSIVLMEILAPYHEYEVRRICGIPEISLAGTVADWRLLRDKVHALPPLGLDDWYARLRSVAGQFARAASGDVDTDHWRNIYRLAKAYGGDRANGWSMHLFPYLRKQSRPGRPEVPNPLIGPDADQRNRSANDIVGVRTNQLPSGSSSVPLVVRSPGQQGSHYTLIAGALGVETRDDALIPGIAWAVQRAKTLPPPLRDEDEAPKQEKRRSRDRRFWNFFGRI